MSSSCILSRNFKSILAALRWFADFVIFCEQNDVKPSIAEFMSYVHTSVNEESQLYLANERRYNYTTPKSFLEQVQIYTITLWVALHF